MHITLFMSARVQMSSSGRQRLDLSVKLWAPSLKPGLCSLRGVISHSALLSPCWKLFGYSSCGGAVILWTHAVDVSPSGSARGLSLSQGKPSSSSEGEHPLKSQTRVHYVSLPTSLHTHHPRWPSQSQTPSASLILTHTVWFSWVCLCPSAATMKRMKSVFVFFSFCRGDRWHVESADTRQVCTLLNWTKSRMPFKFQLSLKCQMGNTTVVCVEVEYNTLKNKRCKCFLFYFVKM